jgi:hypothetical protein
MLVHGKFNHWKGWKKVWIDEHTLYFMGLLGDRKLCEGCFLKCDTFLKGMLCWLVLSPVSNSYLRNWDEGSKVMETYPANMDIHWGMKIVWELSLTSW